MLNEFFYEHIYYYLILYKYLLYLLGVYFVFWLWLLLRFLKFIGVVYGIENKDEVYLLFFILVNLL